MGFSPKTRKKFGQHWLRSEKVLHRIVEASEVNHSDRVLEIGPGTGILTRWLLSLAEAVVAVEIDWDLGKRLRNEFHHSDHFFLLQGDFLELDVADQLASQADFPFRLPNKVVANIPYYITGPILEKLLGTIASPNSNPYDAIVLLVQREVAERLYARPGSRAFGALSVRVQYLATCEPICQVPAAAFHPPPKVESMVVRLVPRSPDIPAVNAQWLDQLIRVGFGSKRKMLRNNLKGIIERDYLLQIMNQLTLSPQARAEDLSVQQWVALSNRLWEDKQAAAIRAETHIDSLPVPFKP